MELNQQSQRHWQEFLYLMEILQRFGCLDELVPTPLDKSRLQFKEIMMWLGLALAREFDNLDPPFGSGNSCFGY